jgi:hypothetical protein
MIIKKFGVISDSMYLRMVGVMRSNYSIHMTIQTEDTLYLGHVVANHPESMEFSMVVDQIRSNPKDVSQPKDQTRRFRG